jgi:putative ABC transport system substrate-binding protein
LNFAMKRRSVLGFAAAALCAPMSLLAQQPGRVYRIGYLSGQAPTPEVRNLVWVPFNEGLREKGWIEGKNVVIESRWAEGRPDRYQELAAELVRIKVDVIVAGPPDVLVAIRKESRTIPIVAALSGDPMRYGLSDSYSKPTGNVTGLTAEAGATIGAKTLEFLKQAAPSVARVGVLTNPASPISPVGLQDMASAARILKLQLHVVEATKPEEFDAAFASMTKARVEALYLMAEPLFFAHRARIAEFAIEHRLPAVSPLPGFASAGGMFDYAVDVADNYRRAAGYGDKILKGAKPSDLPFEQPTKFQLTVNLKTAKVIGLEIPQATLVRADRVIE